MFAVFSDMIKDYFISSKENRNDYWLSFLKECVSGKEISVSI